MSVDDREETHLVRWEIPLSKIIPKKLYEAQQTEFASMPDADLFREACPDSLDWRLRIRYNSLLQQFLDPSRPMKERSILQEEIYRDICSYEVFRRRVDIPAKAVFMTRRLGSYMEDQDALVVAFSSRLWEIASAPIIKPNGQMDHEAVKLLNKTFQILLDRKFGQAVQRQVTAVVPGALPLDPELVESKLRELEEMSK